MNKTALRSNDISSSIDLLQTYAHRVNKNLVYKKEEMRCNKMIKQYKIF